MVARTIGDPRSRPSYVLGVGDRFQVGRVAAVPDEAGVVNFFTIHQGPDVPLEHCPMDVDHDSLSTVTGLDGEHAVALAVRATGPEPAVTCSVESGFDSVGGRVEALL